MRVMNRLMMCVLALALGVGVMAAEDRIDAGMSLERLRRVGTKLKEFVDTDRLPGAVTIVYRRGKMLDVQAVGWQDKEQKVPVRRDTIFRLASMTKPITAVAMMMLIEDGRISLDDPLDRWLPELANRQVLLDPEGPLDKTKPSPRPITVRDLLMYRIGLGMNAASASAPITKAGGMGGNLTGDEWVKRLGTVPLAAAPGERWIYNTPSQLMGVLIARVSGMPFDAFLQQRIFQPLGMKDTMFWVPAEKRSRLATAYTFDEKTGTLQVNKSPMGGIIGDKPPVFPSGAGGLVTTADDYLKFARMLLHKGEVDGVRLLSPKAVQVMTTDYMTKEDRKRASFGSVFADRGFGYGLAIVPEGNGVVGPSVGSFHWDGASGASWIADPREDLITIVLMQQYNYQVSSKVVRDVNTLVYGALVN